MWRIAASSEDEEIVAMSEGLYTEDPSPLPVPKQNTRETLAVLRREAVRGRAVVLELKEVIAGYALLISFWSNELGGEVVVIDELYIKPSYRKQGHGRALLLELAREEGLWPRSVVALELEVTPQNAKAASLYTSVGFQPVKNSRLRYLRGSELERVSTGERGQGGYAPSVTTSPISSSTPAVSSARSRAADWHN